MAAAMTADSGRVWGILLLFVCSSSQSLFNGGDSYKRELTVKLYPNTSSPPPGGELLHVRAVGGNDTLHFLFCSQGAPTLLVVHTDSPSSIVEVNWPQFVARNTSGSLRVEPQSSILYSTAVVFSRLLEYDDENNTAEGTSNFFPPYELQDFSWSPMNLSKPTAVICGSAPHAINGSLCFQLTVFGSEGRPELWPRLLHSPNSSQVEVWLDGLLPRSNTSRFVLELQAVGGAFPLSKVDVRQFIDDEYTPSIFKVSQWVSSANNGSDILGFVQWKPVAYRRPRPALEDATPCRHSEPQPWTGNKTTDSSALIKAFYSDPRAVGMNVSFGIAGEPFYNSTMFLSWTMLVGVGSPPVDSFSPLVIGIMAAGLGIPFVLLLVGGVCVFIMKRRDTSDAAYQPIN
ncbi:PREDICTED: glycosylated lysosomal membrane protein [Cyprinodon variegatus]|uniref:Glycosylated lysosomal membrane protein n=1 Tax=Cyprinodon variegatus TaxID=28743 RepID=A0A3Q2EJT9_CYPVA|nr:PREDICTED: glycosylated lysosomal membrane protein [Cyprinodon variegatus]